MDKREWIVGMQMAMSNREHNRIAELCGKNADMSLNCAEYCPFSNFCYWIVRFAGKLPLQYFEEN